MMYNQVNNHPYTGWLDYALTGASASLVSTKENLPVASLGMIPLRQ